MNFLDKLENAQPKEAVALLSERFSQNKLFFQKNLPNLVQFLDTPTKKYDLNISSAGINIQNKENGEFVYPVIDGQSTIFSASKELAESPAYNSTWHRFANNNIIDEEDIDRVPITGDIVNKIIRRIKEDEDFKEGKLQFSGYKQLPATLFLGISGGLHVEYLLHKYEILHSVLLYEPDTDLFTLSCYFLDYSLLYEKTNEFSCYVVVKGFIPNDVVKDFYASRLISNTFIRFEHYAYRDKYIDDAIQISEEASKTSMRGWGTYEDEVIGVNNKLNWLDPKNPKYPFLSQKKDIGAPIAVVGNGPSLNFLLPFLKENQDNLIILSSGTALSPLKKNGIEPDFQVEIERMDHVKAWLEDAGLEKTPLIGADIIHETTLDTSKETYLFIRTAAAAQEIYSPKFSLDMANPLVGNAGTALALNFSKEVYLCGLDMGFKEDSKQHAKGSKYDDMDDKSVEKIPTRGNLSTNIYTNSLFSLSKISMEYLIHNEKDCQVFNLSDGAYVNGTIPKEFQDIKLKKIDKEKAVKEIKSAFTKEGFFNSYERNFEDELNQFKNDILHILKMAKITDKTMLFKTIDFAFYGTTIQRRSNPVTGTLLSGSFWHILNTIFVMLIHIDRDDVDDLYMDIMKILENQLDRYIIG
ncbi:MAG: DUF115 domain-containing protein [Campylobacterales bacterium]|nr:DUF115 domain-containing protein [Campylobacterales bacterium]